MSRPLFVVNPRSGGGRTERAIDQLLQVSEKALGGIDVERTARPRHAIAIARGAALAGREMVVAVGGDGSIHEVANGLLEAREQGATGTVLGMVGQGTGGDLRRTLGFEHRLDRYLAALAARRHRAMDVGRFSYVGHDGGERTGYFINILSMGVGGLVDQYVAKTPKVLGGKAAYFVASARGLLDSAVGLLDVKLRFEGTTTEHQVRSRQLAICNGRYFGSGMHVAPMADPFDGVFEVIDLGGASRAAFALSSSRVYGGEHLRSPEVHHHRCDRIDVDLVNAAVGDRFLLDVDGEPLGRLPVTVQILPGALEVVIPP